MGNVIIAIGGTGGKVIKALRNRIRQTRGAEGDTNHYLCLDTMGYGYYLTEVYGNKEVQELRNLDTSGEMNADVLQTLVDQFSGQGGVAVEPSEYCQLRGLDLPLLQNLINNPQAENGAFAWLRAANLKGTLNVSDEMFQFKAGAGQYRQIGRIGSMTTALEITRRLKAVEQLSRQGAAGGSRAVYIVCSLAGGTGSGNFIDIGVLARDIFARRDSQGGRSDNVNLLLLLDGAFGSADEMPGRADDMKAISYATLRELGRFQSPPLPKQFYQFVYPNRGRIEVNDQTVFDQVCLIDFAGTEINERFRRSTVYPTMAEMLDLLTAPGTGPAVSLGLINVNKVIRYAQAHSREAEGGLDAKAREAWAKDQFSHYYSTFASRRMLLPRRAYERRAAAREVQRFIQGLIGRDDISAAHEQEALEEAFALVTSRPATAAIAKSLFGGATAAMFRVGVVAPSIPDSTPAHAVVEDPKNALQAKEFLNSPVKEVFRTLSASLAQFIADNSLTRLIDDGWASKDPNIRQAVSGQVDQVRADYLGLRGLGDMAAQPLTLTARAQTQQALAVAIRDQVAAARQQLRESVAHALAQPRALRRTLTILRAFDEVFLRTLIDYVVRRSEALQGTRQLAITNAQNAWATYSQQERGSACLEAGREYLARERRVFEESLRWLANEAQHQVLLEIRASAGRWIEELSRTILDLASDLPHSVYAVAGATVSQVQGQLREWAHSGSVVLGDPGAVKPGDTEMGGFVAKVVGSIEPPLRIEGDTSWQVADEGEKITLVYQDKPLADGKAVADTLRGIALKAYEQAFEPWTFSRYLWEFAAEQDRARLAQIAARQVLEFQNLAAGVAGVNPAVIHSSRYIVWNNPSRELHEGAALMHQFMVEEAHKLKLEINFIEDDSARYETSFVRMDSGLDERNVEKLSECRKLYLQRVRERSRLLPLAHVFPEEQGMVALEIETHGRVAKDEQVLIPSVLAPIFGHERLAELFVSLLVTGFIFRPDSDSRDVPSQYLLYDNWRVIRQSLFADQDRRDLGVKLAAGSVKDVFGDLFALTPDYRQPARGGVPRRAATDAGDLFTAMSHFVQRLPNAMPGVVGGQVEFPLPMEEAMALWEDLRAFWRRRDKDIHASLIARAKHWREVEKALDDITDEIWDAPKADETALDSFHRLAKFYLHGAPLNRSEAKGFVRQLSLLAELYAAKVRPQAPIDLDLI